MNWHLGVAVGQLDGKIPLPARFIPRSCSGAIRKGKADNVFAVKVCGATAIPSRSCRGSVWLP